MEASLDYPSPFWETLVNDGSVGVLSGIVRPNFPIGLNDLLYFKRLFVELFAQVLCQDLAFVAMLLLQRFARQMDFVQNPRFPVPHFRMMVLLTSFLCMPNLGSMQILLQYLRRKLVRKHMKLFAKILVFLGDEMSALRMYTQYLHLYFQGSRIPTGILVLGNLVLPPMFALCLLHSSDTNSAFALEVAIRAIGNSRRNGCQMSQTDFIAILLILQGTVIKSRKDHEEILLRLPGSNAERRERIIFKKWEKSFKSTPSPDNSSSDEEDELSGEESEMFIHESNHLLDFIQETLSSILAADRSFWEAVQFFVENTLNEFDYKADHNILTFLINSFPKTGIFPTAENVRSLQAAIDFFNIVVQNNFFASTDTFARAESRAESRVVVFSNIVQSAFWHKAEDAKDELQKH